MKGLDQIDNCPRCGSLKMTPWDELNDEQKFLVERLPLSAEYPLATRKKHRFCTRCWFEDSDERIDIA